MKLFILLFALIGCTERIDFDQIKKAQTLCSKNGGIRYIHISGTLNPIVIYCNNGGEFKIKKD